MLPRRLTVVTVCLGLLLSSPALAAVLGSCPMGSFLSAGCACKEAPSGAEAKFERRAGCCCELAEPASQVPVVLGTKPATSGAFGHMLTGRSTGEPVAHVALRLDAGERGPPGPSRALFIEHSSLLR